MGGVKVGQAAVKARIQRVGLKGRSGAEAGLDVNGLCQRVCAAEIESSAETLVDGELELMARGEPVAVVGQELSSFGERRVRIGRVAAASQRTRAIGIG